MPFCAMPNIREILLRKRVVINEMNVAEFVNQSMTDSLAPGQTLSKKNSRFSTTSPRPAKSNTQAQINYQPPSLAQTPYSNPFYDNRFPVRNFLFLLKVLNYKYKR